MFISWTGLDFAGDLLLSLDDEPASRPLVDLLVDVDISVVEGERDFLLLSLAECLVGVGCTSALAGDFDLELPLLAEC